MLLRFWFIVLIQLVLPAGDPLSQMPNACWYQFICHVHVLHIALCVYQVSLPICAAKHGLQCNGLCSRSCRGNGFRPCCGCRIRIIRLAYLLLGVLFTASPLLYQDSLVLQNFAEIQSCSRLAVLYRKLRLMVGCSTKDGIGASHSQASLMQKVHEHKRDMQLYDRQVYDCSTSK